MLCAKISQDVLVSKGVSWIHGCLCVNILSPLKFTFMEGWWRSRGSVACATYIWFDEVVSSEVSVGRRRSHSWGSPEKRDKIVTNLVRIFIGLEMFVLLAKAKLKSTMKKSSLDTCDWRTSSSRILCNKYTIFKYYIFKYIFKYYIFKIFFLISVCFFPPPVTAVSSVHFLIPKSMLTLGSHHRMLSMDAKYVYHFKNMLVMTFILAADQQLPPPVKWKNPRVGSVEVGKEGGDGVRVRDRFLQHWHVL